MMPRNFVLQVKTHSECHTTAIDSPPQSPWCLVTVYWMGRFSEHVHVYASHSKSSNTIRNLIIFLFSGFKPKICRPSQDNLKWHLWNLCGRLSFNVLSTYICIILNIPWYFASNWIFDPFDWWISSIPQSILVKKRSSTPSLVQSSIEFIIRGKFALPCPYLFNSCQSVSQWIAFANRFWA